MTCIETLASRYYQLYIAPEAGKSKSAEYERVVCSGGKPDCFATGIPPFPAGFFGSDGDRLFTVQSPVGSIECVYLENRADFERMVQILAWRCESKSVPESMGACSVRNLVNWRKIEAHRAEFIAGGGNPFGWQKEFESFTAYKEKYKDNLIIISRGAYSAVPATETGMEEWLWLEKSWRLRLYHECTHMICRELFPQYISPLWDEVLADCIGLCAAMGRYELRLAERLLGIDGYGWYNGGRLQNYVAQYVDMQQYVPVVRRYTEYAGKAVQGRVFENMPDAELFALLISIEKDFWAESEVSIQGIKLRSTAASSISGNALPTINDYIRYLRRHPVPELFDDDCMDGFAHISREYGNMHTDYAFEEVRLNEPERRMDFSFREQVRSLTHVKEFWFEIDSEQYMGTGPIQPCWFIDAEKVRPKSDFAWLYTDVLPQFLSEDTIATLRPNLERCVRALDGLSPSLYQIGVMAGRGTASDGHAALRIFTQNMRKEHVIMFLGRCGWQGDTVVLSDWMTKLEPYALHRKFNVDFDVLPNGYSEKLGINFYAKKTLTDAQALLAFLEQKCLCLPQKREGVLKLISLPSCNKPWLESYWSHVKLPYQNGAVSAAKAYLTQGHVNFREMPLEYPLNFNLELTDRCPLHCPQCYCKLENAHDMPLETARHWLQEAAAHGAISVELSGGETLCYPHIYEVIAEAYRLGLKPNVALSGAGFSETVLEKLIASGVYGIFISLNAADEKTNALSRDGHALALNALDILRRKHFPRTYINYVMHSTNADSFADMVALAERYSVHSLVVMQFKPNSQCGLPTLPSKAQMEAVAGYINAYRGAVRLSVESCFSPLRALVSQAFLVNTNRGLQKGCSAGLYTFSVSFDGRLTPCRHIPYAESYPTLEEYWRKSPILKELRKNASASEEPCAGCMFARYCRPCRAIGVKLDNEIHAGNPTCALSPAYNK